MNARSSENKTTNKRQFPAKFFDGALGWRRGVWYRGGTRAPSFEDLDAVLPLLSSFIMKRARGLSFSVTIYCFKWLITPNQISVNSKWKLRSGSSWKVNLNLVQGDRKFCGCQKWFGNTYYSWPTNCISYAMLQQWRIKYRILCFDNLENQMVFGEARKENMKQKLIVQK